MNDLTHGVVDEELRECIARQYGYHLSQFGDIDLAQIEALSCFGADISDLTGLERCTSLRSLDLDGCRAPDLTPVGALTHLEVLDLEWATQIGNFEAIAGLRQLRVIDLSFTAIRDLEPLRHLAQLERVRLEQTAVTDLQPLSACRALRDLDTYSCSIVDYSMFNDRDELRIVTGSGLIIGRKTKADLKQQHGNQR